MCGATESCRRASTGLCVESRDLCRFNDFVLDTENRSRTLVIVGRERGSVVFKVKPRSEIAILHFSAYAVMLDGDEEPDSFVYSRWDVDAECFVIADADLECFASYAVELGNGCDDVVEKESNLPREVINDYKSTRNALYDVASKARARARKETACRL